MNMTPPHPGEFIRVEVIEEQDLSLKEAADILDVAEQPLSDLLNGDTELTPDMARRIEKAFGVGGNILLRMQTWHNESRTRVGDDVTVRHGIREKEE